MKAEIETSWVENKVFICTKMILFCANYTSWTEIAKAVVDGTDREHLISELVTLKATSALPVNLALPIVK